LVPFEYANHFEEPIDKQHPMKAEFPWWDTKHKTFL